MRMKVATIACVAIACTGAVVGCGGPGTISTGTIAVGTRVQPEQYLADTRAAADAVARFAQIVNALPKPLTEAALVRSAAEMADPLERVQSAQARLDAMRLEDQRLESQRVRVRVASAAVVQSMTVMRAAAAKGDMPGAKAAAAALQTSIAALRAVTEPIASQ